MIVNFYAHGHRLGDGLSSEGEEWDTIEQVRRQAATFAQLWECEWVNVYERSDPELLMQVAADEA